MNKYLLSFHLLVLDLPRERPIASDYTEGSIRVVRACSNNANVVEPKNESERL